MSNISDIYKRLQGPREDSCNDTKVESAPTSENLEVDNDEKKRDKDLRALIGLELVVDYMNHTRSTLKPKLDIVEETDSFPLKEDLDIECPSVDVVDVLESGSESDKVQW